VHRSRAPVINPFHKLTQKQFDSYVSSIQSKIKVALDPPSPEPHHVSRTFAEISRSTIASPAPSPAPLSKHPSQETRPSSRATHTPLGAGTPNEPYELSDDDVEETNQPIAATNVVGSRSGSEAPTEDEQQPLSAIQEGSDEVDEVGAETDEVQHSADEYGNGNDLDDEGAWGYSGEDASEEDDEISGAEEVEEEDTFVGKGKGRHPAEGPGLAGLLNGSNGHRASGAPESPDRAGHSLRSPDNSFEAGVARMPTLGTTSTPFISRFARRRSAQDDQDSEDEDEADSPPWEAEQSRSMPTVGDEEENVDSDGEASGEARKFAGFGQDSAIEVLDSDEEGGSNGKLGGMEVDEAALSRSTPGATSSLYVDLRDAMHQSEMDEFQFDDSAAFPNQTHEPDSLLDDSMDEYGSVKLPGKSGAFWRCTTQ
jgi:hypothetical protein